MKFWKAFPKKVVLRQFFFVLAIFALLIPTAMWDSNTQVKVSFNPDLVHVKCDQYKMSIQYADIVSAELADLADPGEKVENGYDNDIIRCGIWENETWGEYIIVADVDATNCIVLQLQDGRTLVFNRKDNKATAEDFAQLQTYLK